MKDYILGKDGCKVEKPWETTSFQCYGKKVGIFLVPSHIQLFHYFRFTSKVMLNYLRSCQGSCLAAIWKTAELSNRRVEASEIL